MNIKVKDYDAIVSYPKPNVTHLAAHGKNLFVVMVTHKRIYMGPVDNPIYEYDSMMLEPGAVAHMDRDEFIERYT